MCNSACVVRLERPHNLKCRREDAHCAIVTAKEYIFRSRAHTADLVALEEGFGLLVRRLDLVDFEEIERFPLFSFSHYSTSQPRRGLTEFNAMSSCCCIHGISCGISRVHDMASLPRQPLREAPSFQVGWLGLSLNGYNLIPPEPHRRQHQDVETLQPEDRLSHIQ